MLSVESAKNVVRLLRDRWIDSHVTGLSRPGEGQTRRSRVGLSLLVAVPKAQSVTSKPDAREGCFTGAQTVRRGASSARVGATEPVSAMS